MESLVVFAKQPVIGAVKTRLAEECGEDVALRLYAAFLEDLALTCAQWRTSHVGADPNRRVILATTPDGEDPIFAELARRAGMRTMDQGEGDLGQRLERAMAVEFDRGARAVCVIGSDSPTLPRSLLDHAFRALQFERAVFGPSFDGGYWLVGAQRPAPDLFSDVPWSAANTLDVSLAKLREQGASGHLLPYWFDVDTRADVDRLTTQICALRDTEPKVFEATFRALCETGLHIVNDKSGSVTTSAEVSEGDKA